jgi:hypothetical protein
MLFILAGFPALSALIPALFENLREDKWFGKALLKKLLVKYQ